MIFHDKRLIFIHIQKTGGNAISSALGKNPDCPEKHFFASDLRELYGAEAWERYFKFTFVRNPWDRLVSWWSMINGARQHLTGRRLNKFQTFVLEHAATFEEFLLNCDQEIVDGDGRKWIYRNQIDYVTDVSGRLMVDFVGRFESLRDDFDFVTGKNPGITVLLPHENRSEHLPYREYYTSALANMVGQRYCRDIDAFGYSF